MKMRVADMTDAEFKAHYEAGLADIMAYSRKVDEFVDAHNRVKASLADFDEKYGHLLTGNK